MGKENADIIFEYTLLDQFGSSDFQKNKIIKLLQRSLRDYKKEIDVIIDEFISVACAAPKDKAQILDTQICEETMNIGKLISHLLNPKNRTKYIQATVPKNKNQSNMNNLSV